MKFLLFFGVLFLAGTVISSEAQTRKVFPYQYKD